MSTKTVIPVKNKKVYELLKQLGRTFKTEVLTDCLRQEIVLPEHLATAGRLIAYAPGSGLEALIIQANFNHPTEIIFKQGLPVPISLYTVAKGDLIVSDKQESFTVSPLQGTIHGGFSGGDYRMLFPQQEDFVCLVLFIHKQEFFANLNCEDLNIPAELLEVVSGLQDSGDEFLFQEIFHLPAVTALLAILEQEHTGMLNSTFATAKIHEILFLHLREYKKFEVDNNSRFYRKEEQLQSIKAAERILLSQLQEPPTIPELAKMVGINQQSLKQGFRQVYGETIKRYLTNKRLEQAGLLLQAGELSIGEIALSIGYTSPSYFSKKFKAKFGIPPNKFRQQQYASQLISTKTA